MRGTPEAEIEIMTQILAFKNDPVGFAIYCYPWGRKGTPFESFKGPRDWQLEDLQRIGKHVQDAEFAIENNLPCDIFREAIASGRGPGKSALFGMLAHWHVSTRIGAPVIVTANTETQMRSKTFPEFAVWFGAAINSHWFTVETLRITPQPWLLDLVRGLPEEGGLGIDPRYWYVAGQTWSEDNPDSFAGAHNPYGMCVLFDEASGIATPVWDVAEGFFTEVNPYRFFLAASQMRTRQGRFFELFNDDRMGKGWHRRTISIRGLAGVDQQKIKTDIERYGEDSDYVRVEIDGLAPKTTEDQFIPHTVVELAQRNEFHPDNGEALILGVDPAPRGKTSWRFRQGRNARNCVGARTAGAWYGQDNVQIAENVLKLDYEFRPQYICIDFGMGTGVIDILKRKRTYGKLLEVKFGESPHDKDGEYASHAAELWGRMRSWLPGGMIEVDDGSKGTLSHQLTDRGWKWSGREENKKILETKETLKGRGLASPDDADALACTFEVKNPPRIDYVREPRKSPEEQGEPWLGEDL
jgi:hypothetical protein